MSALRAGAYTFLCQGGFGARLSKLSISHEDVWKQLSLKPRNEKRIRGCHGKEPEINNKLRFRVGNIRKVLDSSPGLRQTVLAENFHGFSQSM